jgi:hypothetical protein
MNRPFPDAPLGPGLRTYRPAAFGWCRERAVTTTPPSGSLSQGETVSAVALAVVLRTLRRAGVLRDFAIEYLRVFYRTTAWQCRSLQARASQVA